MQGLEHVERCLCFLLFFAFYTGNGVDEERKRASRETEKGETAQSRNLTRVHCGKGGRGVFFLLLEWTLYFIRTSGDLDLSGITIPEGISRETVFFFGRISEKRIV